jgi:hypothetical protein
VSIWRETKGLDLGCFMATRKRRFMATRGLFPMIHPPMGKVNAFYSAKHNRQRRLDLHSSAARDFFPRKTRWQPLPPIT